MISKELENPGTGDQEHSLGGVDGENIAAVIEV